jgi:hypothetical protein
MPWKTVSAFDRATIGAKKRVSRDEQRQRHLTDPSKKSKEKTALRIS